jgi:hypothetical protein
MESSPGRVQFGLVATGYAFVLVISAALIYQRYMLYVHHPEDAIAASGMYAAGDWMLELFVICLFLIPTFFLVLIIRESERMYSVYSKILLSLSLTAPACLAVFSIPAVNQGTMLLGYICMDRLFASPLVIAWMGASRFLARFPPSKRRISYAVLIEALTLALVLALFVLSARPRHG